MGEIFLLSGVFCRVSYTDDAWVVSDPLIPSILEEQLLTLTSMAIYVAIRLDCGKRQLIWSDANYIALNGMSVDTLKKPLIPVKSVLPYCR